MANLNLDTHFNLRMNIKSRYRDPSRYNRLTLSKENIHMNPKIQAPWLKCIMNDDSKSMKSLFANFNNQCLLEANETYQNQSQEQRSLDTSLKLYKEDYDPYSHNSIMTLTKQYKFNRFNTRSEYG